MLLKVLIVTIEGRGVMTFPSNVVLDYSFITLDGLDRVIERLFTAQMGSVGSIPLGVYMDQYQ